MIDIHAHLIPTVDDGSKSIDDSLEMIKKEKNIGVTDIICTPHYRRKVFECPIDKIREEFSKLQKSAEGLGVKLHLGQEIATRHIIDNELKSGIRLTLANSKYVLLEFDYNNFVDIADICYELKVGGFNPIIAHAERYTYVSLHELQDIVRVGGLVQVNADSFFKGLFSDYRKKVVTYLKHGLVHFVASDLHSSRELMLKEAFSFVSKKVGAEKAKQLFETNPRAILENKEIQ